MNTVSKWDSRFYELACLVSTWSKDNKCPVGSVLIKDKRIIATGINGFPAGVNDNLSLYNNLETKLDRIVHAETNVLMQCALFGISAKGCTLYTTKFPCLNCSKLIISAGVVRLVTTNIKIDSKWYQDNLKSEALLKEAGVEITYVKKSREL